LPGRRNEAGNMSVELPAPIEALNGQTAGRLCGRRRLRQRSTRFRLAIDHALTPRVIETGNLRVNLDTKTVEVSGQHMHLTGKEYQILELLSLLKGTTLTKEMVLNHLYGGKDEPGLSLTYSSASSGKSFRQLLAASTASKRYGAADICYAIWAKNVLKLPTLRAGSC
jgi:hypothetical protein